MTNTVKKGRDERMRGKMMVGNKKSTRLRRVPNIFYVNWDQLDATGSIMFGTASKSTAGFSSPQRI